MLQATQEADITDQPHDYPPALPDPSHSPNAASSSSIADRPPPLKAPITPYRLFNVTVFLALAIPKAVYSAKGQSVISGHLDWAGGLAALMYDHPRYVERVPKLIPLPITLKLVCF